MCRKSSHHATIVPTRAHHNQTLIYRESGMILAYYIRDDNFTASNYNWDSLTANAHGDTTMHYIQVKTPPRSLQEAIAKRQGISMKYVQRNLRDPRGDRIYFYHGKNGAEIAMLGFI